jgi:hypothetical protein
MIIAQNLTEQKELLITIYMNTITKNVLLLFSGPVATVAIAGVEDPKETAIAASFSFAIAGLLLAHHQKNGYQIIEEERYETDFSYAFGGTLVGAVTLLTSYHLIKDQLDKKAENSKQQLLTTIEAKTGLSTYKEPLLLDKEAAEKVENPIGSVCVFTLPEYEKWPASHTASVTLPKVGAGGIYKFEINPTVKLGIGEEGFTTTSHQVQGRHLTGNTYVQASATKLPAQRLNAAVDAVSESGIKIGREQMHYIKLP